MFLLAVILAAVPASAQLRVKAKSEAKTLGTIRMGMIRVHQLDGLIYLSMDTNNQFDLPGIFDLGEGKEAALATVDDLVAFLAETDPEERVVVESSRDADCVLQVDIQIGIRVLRFSFTDRAGYQEMMEKDLKRIRSIIEKAE